MIPFTNEWTVVDAETRFPGLLYMSPGKMAYGDPALLVNYRCGHSVEFDTSALPVEKGVRVFRGSLMTSTCPRCGYSTGLERPLWFAVSLDMPVYG